MDLNPNQNKLPNYTYKPKWFSILLILSLLSMAFLFLALSSSIGWSIMVKNGTFPDSSGRLIEYLQAENQLNQYKLLQAFVSIATFGLSCFAFALFVRENPLDYFGFYDKPGLVQIGIAIGFMLVIQPFSSHLVSFNNQIQLPDALKEFEVSLRAAQNDVLTIQKLMLGNMNLSSLLLNLLLMAVLPAFLEELFFRKALLRLLYDSTHKVHLSIFVSGFLFALIHQEVFNLLPLFLFGIVLGYLSYWSGTLWLPVLAHFINNTFSILVVYISQQYPEIVYLQEDYVFPFFTVILSAVLGALLLFSIYKKRISINN